MKGMILAAGFGTRLGATEIPKPLVPAAGRPMIAWALDALRQTGCTEIVVNTYHRAEPLEEYLLGRDHGVPVRVIREAEILGTGGGVLNAAGELDDGEPFLLHNADIYTAAALQSFVAAHRETHALATLLVNRRDTRRALLFDEDMRLLGKEQWREQGAVFSNDARRFGFCGIHVISGAIFRLGVPLGFSDIFDIYRTALEAGMTLRGFETNAYWTDLGTEERIRAFDQWKAAR